MKFSTEVIGCYWEEDKGEWLVKLRENRPGQEPREFEDRCNILLHVSLDDHRASYAGMTDLTIRVPGFSTTTSGLTFLG